MAEQSLYANVDADSVLVCQCRTNNVMCLPW